MNTQTASTSERPSEIQMGQKIVALENEVATLRRTLAVQRHVFEYFDRYGYDFKAITEKLHGCSRENNVWLAVQLFLKQFIKGERDAAHTSQLGTNEQLRTAVGRVSALEDFQTHLFEAYAQANPTNKG